MNSDVLNWITHTSTLCFLSSLHHELSLGPSLAVRKSQNSDFLCSTATFLLKLLMGDIYLVVWRVNFKSREVTGSFLRGTPGASVIQWDGGFLPDRGERMDEIRSSQPGNFSTTLIVWSDMLLCVTVTNRSRFSWLNYTIWLKTIFFSFCKKLK